MPESATMFEQLEPLNAQHHADLRLRRLDDFRFAADQGRIPLVFSEITEAAKHFPIVFPGDAEARPVALLALEADHNRFVADDGRWLAGYVPAHVRRYPFILDAGGEGGSRERVVLIDRAAPHWATDPAEGRPLFESAAAASESAGVFANESASEPLRGAIDFLRRFQDEADATPTQLSPLVDSGVLVERQLDIRVEGERRQRIRGVRVVDREQLMALDDATLAVWARTGLLEAVHAHLQSLGNLRRLAACRT